MLKKNKKFFLNIVFLNFFILFFTLFSFAKSQEIQEIVITGNERISNETIILFSGVKLNHKITNENLNEILKNLYNTNFFENVSVKLIDDELII